MGKRMYFSCTSKHLIQASWKSLFITDAAFSVFHLQVNSMTVDIA